jgi:hypothetical protein
MISVLLPFNKFDEFLLSALRSIGQPQTQQIVLVDNSGSDECYDLHDVVDCEVRLVRCSGTLVDCLTLGLETCSYELVARMDSDDLSRLNRFERQFEMFRLRSELSVLGSQISYVDTLGRKLPMESRFPTDFVSIHRQLMTGKCALSHPSVVFKSSCVRAVGGYRKVFEAAEDYDLWLRIAQSGYEIMNCNEVLLDYRIHPGQISVLSSARQLFSRDLALLCARDRQAGLGDPADGMRGPPSISRSCDVSAYPFHVQELIVSHMALGHLFNAPDSIDWSELKSLFSLARLGYVGGSRKRRAVVAAEIARIAVSRGHWCLALSAARLALEDGRLRGVQHLLRFGDRRCV